jgi:serine/threonine protein kinase/signal transduction histidine kinase/tetratricopeptide (TPR) repeat protein
MSSRLHDPEADATNGSRPRKDRRVSVADLECEEDLARLPKRYRLTRFLGEEFDRRVYLVHDRLLDKAVRLALIEGGNRGLNEQLRIARSMTTLGRDSNIAAILDFGRHRGKFFVVTEHCASTLADLLAGEPREPRTAIRKALWFGERICRGLETVHALGVVHQNLHPGVVLLTQESEVRLADFALGSFELLLPFVSGRPHLASFVAPEVILGRARDSRTDLYSLGAILYYMICGRTPFEESESASILSQHVTSRPAPLSVHNPDVTAELEALVLSQLSKSQDERSDSAQSLRTQLTSLRNKRPKLHTSRSTEHAEQTAATLLTKPFVGRVRENYNCRKAIAEALKGCPAFITISGDHGIGKTRLAEECSAYAKELGFTVLYGRCFRGETTTPYAPFVEIIRECITRQSGHPVSRKLEEGLPYLAKLVQESSQSSQALTLESEIEPEQERFRLFDNIRSLLSKASVDQPMMLVLEDMHWSDDDSLLFLQHLVRRSDNGSLVVVCTYCDSDLRPGDSLASTLAELARERSHLRIGLRGLSTSEVKMWFEELIAEPSKESWTNLAEVVRSRTGGNPFLVKEVISHLMEKERFRATERGWTIDESAARELEVPAVVRTAISLRLKRLSSNCNIILREAAVLGSHFELEVIRELTELGYPVLVAALDEALRAGLVRKEENSRATAYSFVHEIMHQAVYDQIAPSEQQSIHHRAAIAIETLNHASTGTSLSALASHYAKANPESEGDMSKAVDYSTKAGEAAYAVYGYEEATAHWQTALNLMDSRKGPTERRAHLLQRLAMAVSVTSPDRVRAIELLERAAFEYEKLGDSRTASIVRANLGILLAMPATTIDVGRSIENLDKASKVVGNTLETSTLALIHLGYGCAAQARFQTEAALAACEQALDAADQASDRRTQCRTNALKGFCLWAMGRLGDGLSLLDQTRIQAESIDCPTASFAATWQLGYAWTFLWAPQEARRRLEDELTKLKFVEAPLRHRSIVGLLGLVYIFSGELEKAKDHQIHAKSAMLGGLITFVEGDWGRTESILRREIARCRRAGASQLVWNCSFFLAWILRLNRRFSEAVEVLLTSNVFESNTSRIPEEMRTRAELALLFAEMGRVDDAQAQLEWCLRTLSEGEDWHGLVGIVKRSLGVVSALGGSMERAENRFREATEIFAFYGTPWEQADLLYLWGQSLKNCGQDHDANEKFDGALEAYRRLQAGPSWIHRVLTQKLGFDAVPSRLSRSHSAANPDDPPAAITSKAQNADSPISTQVPTASPDHNLLRTEPGTIFLHRIKEEIRHPVHTMLGYTEMMQSHLHEAGDHTQDGNVDRICVAGNYLASTVTKISDLAMIESGTFEVDPKPVQLDLFLKREVNHLLDSARSRGLRLNCIVDECAIVSFDQYCLSGAISNLIRIAIANTRKGSVRVRLYRDLTGKVCIDVAHPGAIMDAERFDRIVAGDPARKETENTETWLGLPLTNRYLQLGGAVLMMKPASGEESTFVIVFSAENGVHRAIKQRKMSPLRLAFARSETK